MQSLYYNSNNNELLLFEIYINSNNTFIIINAIFSNNTFIIIMCYDYSKFGQIHIQVML